jgi:hypothetical protein
VFAVADSQEQAKRLAARPGTSAIAEQLAALAPGQAMLVDDDIASGWTIEQLQQRLRPTVTITATASALGSTVGQCFDVCDLRDFLVGSRAGGLVVEDFHGQPLRVPYLAPFVCLHTRASLAPAQERSVSLDLWQANAELFAATSLTIADTDNRAWWLQLGFTDDTPLADLCRWYAEQLAELPFQLEHQPWPVSLQALSEIE